MMNEESNLAKAYVELVAIEVELEKTLSLECGSLRVREKLIHLNRDNKLLESELVNSWKVALSSYWEELGLENARMNIQRQADYDVRNWSPARAQMSLFRAEITYLTARGWVMLVGGNDPKCYLPPGVDNYKEYNGLRYTHEEALHYQKDKDNEIDSVHQ